MKKVFLSILFIVFGYAIAVAAPVVTGAAGSFVNGSTTVLSVTDPGTGSTILSWDDFEAHNSGASLDGGGLSPIVGPNWTTFKLAPASDPIVISTTRAHSGTKSVSLVWVNDTVNSFGWQGRAPLTELYISWWGYQQYSGDITTCNRKWFYTYGTGTCGTLSEAPQFMPAVPSGNATWGAYNNVSTQQPNWSGTNNMSSDTTYGTGNTVSWTSTRDVWNRWEYRIRLNTDAACTIGSNCDGIVEYWVDAVKRFGRSDYKHRFCSGQTVDDFRLGHMWQGSNGQASAWIDDVFVSTSPARVELGNASTFASCTQREVQRHVSWTSNQIQIQVSLGKFTIGQSLWLFVVDSSGNASPGYPIVAGASTSPTVLSVTGTVQNKSTVQIAGVNFGTKAHAAPLKFDDFEGGTPGNRVTNGWYTYTQTGGYFPTYSVANIRYPGTKSAHQKFSGCGDYACNTSYLGLNEGLSTPTLYVTGWFQYSTAIPSMSAYRNAKLMTVERQSTNWQSRFDIDINGSAQLYAYLGCAQVTDVDQYISGSLAMQNNSNWHRMESTVVITDGANDWRDYKIDLAQIAYIAGDFGGTSCAIDLLLLGHYIDSDASTNEETNRYWDQIYVDDTISRVEIGNAATWAACTHREIQIPSRWDATGDRIDVTINQGTFANNTQAYMYIVDDEGDVSQGFPVTFSSVVVDECNPGPCYIKSTGYSMQGGNIK